MHFFFRDLCEKTIDNNPQELGGFNENGEPIEVEIDGSNFFHRKYHSGQWRERHWVFGAVERRTRRCFLVEVPDRTAATLEPIIRRCILPSTHIISDGWAAYANIENIANGIYTHSVIVHERNFVDPIEPGVHTQVIENTWIRAKQKMRSQYGTSVELFAELILAIRQQCPF